MGRRFEINILSIGGVNSWIVEWLNGK